MELKIKKELLQRAKKRDEEDRKLMIKNELRKLAEERERKERQQEIKAKEELFKKKIEYLYSLRLKRRQKIEKQIIRKGEIQKILDKVNHVCSIPASAPKKYEEMTLVEKIKKIEQVLEEDIRPKLNLDGGSVELVDLDGHTVKVRLIGMCSGCAGAQGTLKNFIEKVLQDRVCAQLTVEQA